MDKLTKKQQAAADIIDNAKAELEKLGVKYYLVALDRAVKAKNGGRIIFQSSVFKGEDLTYFIAPFIQDRQMAIALGHCLGNAIHNDLKTPK